MLYITGIPKNRMAPDIFQWNIGEPMEPITNIVSVQADGEELEEILQWENIPKVVVNGYYSAVMVWVGDAANFIYQNLMIQNQ